MCHQSRAPVPRSEVILARLRVAPTRPPRAPPPARDATIFPPPHPPLHARLARSRASTTVPSRAADHPARLARSSTLARVRNHPSSSPASRRRRTRRTRRANTRVYTPSPFPRAHRIASHRTRRTHDAARASDAMRRPPRRRRGRVAETWGSRGGTHDESRPVTIARDARDSIGPSSDRRRAMPRSRTGDDKKRTIVTYIHSECRCVWDGCS